MTRCNFDMAWVGKCKEPTPCPKHATLKCSSCGAPATHDCDYTGALVCGVPLCDNCIGINDPRKAPGFMGFGPHKHIQKPQGHAQGYSEALQAMTCECGKAWSINSPDIWTAWEEHILHEVPV